jgi:hypothetical protein
LIPGKRVIVVLPAYNAARTLEKIYAELPRDVVDEIFWLTTRAGTTLRRWPGAW